MHGCVFVVSRCMWVWVWFVDRVDDKTDMIEML